MALGDPFSPGGVKASAFHDLGHGHHCRRSLLGRPELAEVKRLSEALRKRAWQGLKPGNVSAVYQPKRQDR
jgi:hypothetical protein